MLTVTPSGGVCGATVSGIDLTSSVSQVAVDQIREAWLEHKVLAFPDQPLTDDGLVEFAGRFGPIGEDPFFEAVDGHDHVAAIHRRADETSALFGENWHADWTFLEFPPDGTCLHARIVPPTGGDTLFADQEAALAAMPLELRARIDGVMAVHSARGGYAPDGMYGTEDSSDRAMRIVVSDDAYATRRHPFVRVHPETGRRALYSTLGYIIDLEGVGDAASLLRTLYDWQTRPEFVHRQRWGPHMLVMWDNRWLLHRATAGYEGHERLLHRTTIGQRDPRPIVSS